MTTGNEALGQVDTPKHVIGAVAMKAAERVDAFPLGDVTATPPDIAGQPLSEKNQG